MCIGGLARQRMPFIRRLDRVTPLPKPLVYVETSVVGSLVGRLSRDMPTLTRQQITRAWWPIAVNAYDLRISVVVLEEAGRGDPEAASERLAALQGLPVLDTTAESLDIAKDLIAANLLPVGSDADAAHIAVAATNGMDFLVTWNFKHLNNIHAKLRIERALAARGLRCPMLCSPEEMGVPD